MNMHTEQAAALARAEKAVLGEIWTSSEAYDNLVYLCDRLGNRWAGSASEREAAEYLLEKARQYGLREVTGQEFRHDAWTRGPVRLDVVAPVAREVAAIALPYTPPAELEGEVVWVGQGEAEDFQRLEGEVKGKIVLSAAEASPGAGQRSSHRREKFARAIGAGAIAFLFANQNPGMLAITGALAAGFPAEIPGLGLPKESGDFIVRLLQSGPVRLRLMIEARFAPTSSLNVLGQIGPASPDGPFLIVGGHYDAHDVAVGALDNAAGSMVCLEAARALATVADDLPMPVRVALFACEEVGLLGAWHYADQAKNDLDRCRFVLNIDSAARGYPGNENLNLCGFPDLVPYFQNVGREMRYEFPVKDGLSAYSDHFPFAVAGVPNATMGASDASSGLVGRGWGHTAADTVDKVTPKSLQASAATAARVLLRLAFEESWPAQHRTRADMAETIAKSPIGWYVEKFGRYPFQPRER
ncbi:MAG TPA: M28 family peptidase [Chloroflexota bacterium]|nr:M28 family peptidase [Chloroflexota bacterium]